MSLTSVRVTIGVLVLLISASALPGAATHAAGKSAAAPSRDVIVILRDQRPDLPAVRGARDARAAALASAQGPIVAHMQASGASRIHGFALINAVSAHVSSAEADALASHPLVQAVVPVQTITLPRHTADSLAGARSSSAAHLNSAAAAGGAAAASSLCNTLEPEALQVTHTAYLDASKPQAQEVVDGNGQKVTGKGVKVAWIADGMDPTLPGFTHTDGTPVFFDYQDFSGDPAGAPTGGDEAFGDASSIAAQDTPNGTVLTFDISQYVNAAHPLPSPCNVRIRGMAPGASLAGLKIFNTNGQAQNTQIVQAIEWAVFHDDVDVINESFGGNPFPDNDNDPVALADQAAVAAGVTVVASTGDAGYNGTLGTPSTDSAVISAGASTTLRLYAQIAYGAAPFASNGWISNNISALSSGGFSMTGPRVPDVVAPGDLGWALCSTNIAVFQSCTNDGTPAAPSPVEAFGGTSESSPLTAGEAALVIQAYRSTHHGRTPAPALVKEIIMSTATDLGAPPSEQGAGLIDALAAVNAALSVHDQNGRGMAQVTGTSLLNSPASASITDHPGASESVSVAITNTGAVTQHLQPQLQALGPSIAGANMTLTLNPATDPTFPNVTGSPRAYITQTFNVPAGAQHLDAAIAWKAPFFQAPTIAYLGLIDPSGRDAAYSIPQGAGSGYAHVDVVSPAAGTWTAVIWTRAAGLPEAYSGPVQFSWSAENYVTFGSVSPARFDLAPRATEWVTARFRMPDQAGDQGVAIRFASGTHSDIPIALRTLIPTGPNGGSFSGTLTGGNARGSTGPTQTFAFDVPPGLNNMNLNLHISDSLYLLEGLLIDPNGMQLSVQGNVDVTGNSVNNMELDRASPQPGRWRFILLVNNYVSGNEISLPFTAQIGFNAAQVSAAGLPNSPSDHVSASGAPLVVPISITNNSGLTEAYFADARLGAYTALSFGPLAAQPLPGGSFGLYLPTQMRSVAFTAQSTAPITMEAEGETGYIVGLTGAPDIAARPVGPNTVTASLTKPEVPWGLWLIIPALQGPFGAAGATPTSVTASGVVELKAFDTSISSNSGDLWSDITLGTATFNPVVVPSGTSATINVTIQPSAAQIGSVVRGSIYIDTFNPINGNSGPFLGDEVVAIPYTYKVTP